MRYFELMSESLGSMGTEDLIKTILLSLSSSGLAEIPVESINNELRNKMNITLNDDELSEILKDMPGVVGVENGTIQLGDDDIDPESKEKVANMAKAQPDNTF